VNLAGRTAVVTGAGSGIVRGVAKGRARILVGMDAKVGSLIERLMPVSYWSLLGRALQ
jgi:NAD(P)-dependent dehydrogenase (short-subunit alcohol dehydrogenase family)